MIEKKLEALFSQLSEEEINIIENSDINTECDIDPKSYSRIIADVKAKTQPEEIIVVSSKNKNKRSMGKRIKAILVAAAIFVVLTIGVGAAYQFIMPDGLNEELALNDMHIKTVVDTEKADENSVRTMQKTVNSNGYTVTFEAIIDGYVILPEFIANLRGLDITEEIREDKIYAVFTITRDDRKNVIYPEGVVTCSCCMCHPRYLVSIDGYVPDSTMFDISTHYYEEGNMLYLVCDITEAGMFADNELEIVLYDNEHNDRKIIRCDENYDCYFIDSYDGLSAIFDLNLEEALADPQTATEYISERPYSFRTSFDYKWVDEEMAADEKLKDVDLSYAIGNHEWHGYYPLQFGNVPHAEDFIRLFNNRANMTKANAEIYNQAVAEASEISGNAYIKEIERITGKSMEELTDDELNAIGENMEAFDKENGKITAEFLKEKFEFEKFDDGSEYCYISEYLFLYIPTNSNDVQLVIVLGDKIVINLDCTVNSMSSIYYPEGDHILPANRYAYWYIYGLDEEFKNSEYFRDFDLEQYNNYCSITRDIYDAIFNLVIEYAWLSDGTVEVLR